MKTFLQIFCYFWLFIVIIPFSVGMAEVAAYNHFSYFDMAAAICPVGSLITLFIFSIIESARIRKLKRKIAELEQERQFMEPHISSQFVTIKPNPRKVS